MTPPSELMAPVPVEIVDQLAACWFDKQQAVAAAGLDSISHAIDELRESVAAGAPYELSLLNLVMLGCYQLPANRDVIAALLSPEYVAVADRIAAGLTRLWEIQGAGFSELEAVSIALAEAEVRSALPDAILDAFGGD